MAAEAKAPEHTNPSSARNPDTAAFAAAVRASLVQGGADGSGVARPAVVELVWFGARDAVVVEPSPAGTEVVVVGGTVGEVDVAVPAREGFVRDGERFGTTEVAEEVETFAWQPKRPSTQATTAARAMVLPSGARPRRPTRNGPARPSMLIADSYHRLQQIGPGSGKNETVGQFFLTPRPESRMGAEMCRESPGPCVGRHTHRPGAAREAQAPPASWGRSLPRPGDGGCHLSSDKASRRAPRPT